MTYSTMKNQLNFSISLWISDVISFWNCVFFFSCSSGWFTFWYDFVGLLVSNYCRLVLFIMCFYFFLILNIYIMHAHKCSNDTIQYSMAWSFWYTVVPIRVKYLMLLGMVMVCVSMCAPVCMCASLFVYENECTRWYCICVRPSRLPCICSFRFEIRNIFECVVFFICSIICYSKKKLKLWPKEFK